MSQHRAYVQNAVGAPLELQTVDTPQPTYGQVLIKVLATPISSASEKILNGLFPLAYPLTLGVSAIGRVVSTGPDSAFLQENQLVYCNPTVTARDDPDGSSTILQGWIGGWTPAAQKLMDAWRNGPWAEKMIVPTENVVPLDETRLLGELGYKIPDLVWINYLVVSLGGFLAANLTPGETVIVAPATGHFSGAAVKVALAMGAGRVVAVGRNKEALEAVAGFDKVLNRVKTVVLSGDVEADSQLLRQSTPGGKGAHLYIDFSPAVAHASTHPKACVLALRKGGRAVLMGGIQSDISFNYIHLMLNNITVQGCYMYPNDAPAKLVALVESGLLSLSGLDVTPFDFDKLQEGIKTVAKDIHFGNSGVLTIGLE